MANMGVVLPCAVLGGICAIMLAFIWWWFPRTWVKGSKQENQDIGMSLGSPDDGLTQQERRQAAGQRAREYLAAVDARNKARAAGQELDDPPPVYPGFQRGPQDYGSPTVA